MSKRTSMIVVAAILGFVAYNVFPWGMGHNSQTDQVWKSLPESFKNHFTEEQRQNFVRHYSHYTDWYASYANLPERNEPAAKTCRDTVREMKFNPHLTHIVFPLFVKTLREKRYDDALMWGGCMSHSIGDMGALNHPDIIWFPEVCLGWSGVKGADGKSIPSIFAPDHVYFSTYFDKKFQSFYDKAMEGCKGKVISTDPQEALEHIILRDHYRKEEMNTNPKVYNIFMLTEQYAKDNSHETLEKIAEALAEYTKDANREILDTLVTGIAFAEMDPEPEFDCGKARQSASKKLGAPPPEKRVRAQDMIVFTGIWQDQPRANAVGVIVSDRPSLVYGGGCPFGSKHQWLTSIILHSLKAENIPYQCLPYERLPRLDPRQNPVLLIVAPNSRGKDFTDLTNALTNYMEAGGRLIWLGGDIPAKLANLLPENELPPSPKGNKFLFPFPVMDKSKKVEAKFVRLADGKQFPVADLTLDNPAFSWNTFGECRCLFFKDFKDDDTKKALMKLKTPGIEQITAVRTKVGKGELIYMPWFVMCPYMLSDQRIMESISNLALDSAGKDILLPALNAGTPSPATNKRSFGK